MKSNITLVLDELSLFSNKILTSGPDLILEDVNQFQNHYELCLPLEVITFLKKFNGMSLMGAEILGFNKSANSISEVYYREHFLVAHPQFSKLIPISPDGAGNFYCLDVSKCNSGSITCPVIFWASNVIYNDVNQPQLTHDSFCNFVKQVVIDWLLEDYDYNGNKR